MRRISTAVSAMSAALAFASGACAQAVQPGEWSVTTAVTSMQVANMPPGMAHAMSTPRTTQTCVTPEKAARGFRANMARDAECPTKSMNMAGGMIDAHVVCTTARGTRTMHFHGPYSPTGYSLTADSTETGPRLMSMTMTMTAKRIGPFH